MVESWQPERSAPRTRVGFSYARGLAGITSRLIRLVSKSRASHAWLLYYDNDFGCDMVMEAHLEWRLIPFRSFCKHNKIVAVYTPMQVIDRGLRVGGTLLGSSYDVFGLFGMAFVEFGRRIKRRIRNPFRSRRSVFCTEGVARVLRAAGYPGTPADPESVDPEDLLNLFERDGSKLWTKAAD